MVVDSQQTKRTNSPLRRDTAATRMCMKTRFSVVILAIVTSLAAQETTQPVGAQKRLLTEKDLFDFVWVANPQLSPDGASVAFTRVNCDEKRTGYETSIWIAAADGKEAPLRM